MPYTRTMPAVVGLVSASTAYAQGDYAAAFADFRELAPIGQPTAQYNLVVMYAKGQGTRPSDNYGLKAQAQCRAALETLVDMKNPAPFAYVRQANIAHGPQQVNNAPPPAAEPSRA